jgi:tRNA threonylcarbamoyladenosine biosynthesis protein TsaB
LGPGSFTGLRIGLMAAKTFSHLGNIKLMGISTLESLAYPLRYTDGIICPVLDALKGDIYCAMFQCKNNHWEQKLPDSVMSLDKFLIELNQNDKTLPILFIGNAVEKYLQEIQTKFGKRIIIPSGSFQIISPGVIAELALDKIKNANAVYLDPLSIKPHYLRRPQAEIVWEQKHHGK